jgi:hypothetical protein
MTQTRSLRRAAFACVILYSISAPLMATTCRSLADTFSRVLADPPSPSDRTLFHGRVLRRTGPDEAEVQVLEVFSGKAERRVLLRSSPQDFMRGTSLRPGEEVLFSPDERGHVSLCTKQAVFPGDIELLRNANAKRKR